MAWIFAHEQKVGNLLDHLERIGDATCPESVPDVVDPGTKFTRQHVTPNQPRTAAGATNLAFGGRSRHIDGWVSDEERQTYGYPSQWVSLSMTGLPAASSYTLASCFC